MSVSGDVYRILSEAANKEIKDSEMKKKSLKEILSKIQSVKSELSDFQNTFIANSSKYIRNSKERGSLLTQAYNQAKISMNNEKAGERFEEIAKEGYELVNKVRQVLTGEEIKYTVGADKGEDFMVGTFTWAQISKKVTFQARESGEIAMKLSVTSKMIKQLTYGPMLMGRENPWYERVQHWSKYINIPKSGKKTRVLPAREGQLFEAYVALANRYDVSDLQTKKKGIIHRRIYSAVKAALSGGGPSGSFEHGGDVENYQAKYGGATVTSIKTIINALDRLEDGLTVFINENNTDKLVKQFKKSHGGDQSRLAKAAEKESIRKIQETLASMM